MEKEVQIINDVLDVLVKHDVEVDVVALVMNNCYHLKEAIKGMPQAEAENYLESIGVKLATRFSDDDLGELDD